MRECDHPRFDYYTGTCLACGQHVPATTEAAPPVTTAQAIPASIARVVPKTAARLGYNYVAICEHCRRPIVALVPTTGWAHRDSKLVECAHD